MNKDSIKSKTIFFCTESTFNLKVLNSESKAFFKKKDAINYALKLSDGSKDFIITEVEVN